MRLLTWNLQWCRGVDGRVDPARIAAEVRRIGDADLLCFQEVAANFPELEGNDAADQAHLLAHAFAGYTACFVSAMDTPAANGRRGYFGNLLLSRLPLGRVLRHSLPWPPEPDVPSMPRAALEATVQAPLGPLRVLVTHLEAYSQVQRAAQVERLRELHAEACGARHAVDQPGAFRSWPRPPSAILCGDFNLAPDNALHARLTEAFPAPGIPRFEDAWQRLHPGQAHPPTFRVHARSAGQAPACYDYAFVTEDLAPRLRAVRIDGGTQASDHQPLLIELA